MASIKDKWSIVVRAWLPIIPGVGVIALLAWGDFLLHTGNIDTVRRALSVGAAGYLFTLAGFTFFGRRSVPASGQDRVAASLAIGLGFVFLSLLDLAWLRTSPGIGVPPGNESDPLSPVNATAAVLAVVLAVVTLIAQKSASDARMEAEKARNDILGAVDIRLLATSTRLLALAQDAGSMARDFIDDADSIALKDEAHAKYLVAAALALGRLRRFLSALHLWSQEADVASVQEVGNTLYMLSLDLDTVERLSGNFTPLNDHNRVLRLQFWHPVARTLEKLLVSLQVDATSSTVLTIEVLAQIRALRERLNTL